MCQAVSLARRETARYSYNSFLGLTAGIILCRNAFADTGVYIMKRRSRFINRILY